MRSVSVATPTVSIALAEPLRAIEPGVRRKILSSNAATLYRIPVPDAA